MQIIPVVNKCMSKFKMVPYHAKKLLEGQQLESLAAVVDYNREPCKTPPILLGTDTGEK